MASRGSDCRSGRPARATPCPAAAPHAHRTRCPGGRSQSRARAEECRPKRPDATRMGAAIAATAAALGVQGSAMAAGAADFPSGVLLDSAPVSFINSEMSDKKLLEAEDAFQNSALLKELKERTEKNAEKNRRDIEAKYCARQAEIGVGDCGGLRDIPGMTKSGKQKTPQWLGDLLGMEAMEDVELLGGPMDLGDLDLEDSEEAPQGQPEDSGTVPESGDVDIELGDLE